MAHAYAEMLDAESFDMTRFDNHEGYELVMVQNIPLRSVCEHHMLPFIGRVHIGYLPGHYILGLCKFARTVALYANRPQTQERLTQQIADELEGRLNPRGVGVTISAGHMCMTQRGANARGANARGANARGAKTVTSAMYGDLRNNPTLRAEFLLLARPDV